MYQGHRGRPENLRDHRGSPPKAARNAEIAAAYRRGATLAGLARQHGVTPQRIQAILSNIGFVFPKGKK